MISRVSAKLLITFCTGAGIAALFIGTTVAFKTIATFGSAGTSDAALAFITALAITFAAAVLATKTPAITRCAGTPAITRLAFVLFTRETKTKTDQASG